MGGVAKCLLAHPDETGTVIDHVVRQARDVCEQVVLVGTHPSYRSLGIACLEDAVAGVGPAGGLLALLRHARGGVALALACDMPYLHASLLEELVRRVEDGAPAVVPQRGGKLEPLCAAYRADVVSVHVAACLDRGIRGLHRIAREAGAQIMPLEGERARWLDDWDEPADMA